MTVDNDELKKFAKLADQWWQVDGKLKTLHDINPARLDFISQYVDWKNSQVLDVGCGGGILTEAMKRHCPSVSGIDCEKSAIDAAIAHAVKSNLSINYQHKPIEEVVVENNQPQFDVITCLEMLEHVPDPSHIIKHCARVVKPGGWCFFSTINRTVKAYMTAILGAEYLLKLLPRQTHDYQKFIKPSELAKALRDHDLELVSLQGLSYNPLSRQASLNDNVSVNYLIAAKKAL